MRGNRRGAPNDPFDNRVHKFEVARIWNDREGNLVTTLANGPDLNVTVELLDAEIRKVLDK